MKSKDQTTAIIIAILSFIFGLVSTAFKFIIAFLFSDSETAQKISDPLLKNQSQISWTGFDEITDSEVKLVSKDGFIDY